MVLGDNPAAQFHAEDSLATCISGHWNTYGLNNRMRYSLAGDYQAENENVSGSDYCISAGEGYGPISSIEEEIQQAMDGWMDSPGHRASILRPRQRKVNIGLAWDRYNFVAVQQFESDFIEYDSLPTFDDEGVLLLKGNLKNGASLDHNSFRVILTYMQPPSPLTRGQLARTYGSCLGRKVAHLSPFSDGVVNTTWKPCSTPYDIPADVPPPTSRRDSRNLWLEAKERFETQQAQENVPIVSQKIRMSRYDVAHEAFVIEANLSDVLSKHGPGVYTVWMYAVVDEEVAVISEYAIFHDTEIVNPYGARRN